MTTSSTTKTRPVNDSFALEVLEGLNGTPRTISPAFFYNAKGSVLFDEITRQPEYYQARTERGILDSIRSDLAAHLQGPIELVEFGAGSAEKTETLLEALDVATYRPVDVSASALEGAARRLGSRFPGIAIDTVVQDYHNPVELGPVPKGQSRVAFFPGSTVGNFHPSEAAKFLGRVARMLGKGGALVLGVDLVKDPDVLHAAYNDAAGVTAEFNLNALRHVNARTDAGFDVNTWKHYSFFNTKPSRTICSTVILPLPNTIALGAVATGSIKAQLAESAAGNISSAGSKPAPREAAARIGISKVVVAVLLVISVKNVTAKATTAMSIIRDSRVTPDSASPIAWLMPVTANALAIAMPPANKSNTPQ